MIENCIIFIGFEMTSVVAIAIAIAIAFILNDNPNGPSTVIQYKIWL